MFIVILHSDTHHLTPMVCIIALSGISTDANDRQIKKAFRKLALKYHPDKVPEAEKEKSEAKFKELAHCYES